MVLNTAWYIWGKRDKFKTTNLSLHLDHLLWICQCCRSENLDLNLHLQLYAMYRSNLQQLFSEVNIGISPKTIYATENYTYNLKSGTYLSRPIINTYYTFWDRIWRLGGKIWDLAFDINQSDSLSIFKNKELDVLELQVPSLQNLCSIGRSFIMHLL